MGGRGRCVRKRLGTGGVVNRIWGRGGESGCHQETVAGRANATAECAISCDGCNNGREDWVMTNGLAHGVWLRHARCTD